ncbi:class I SAM-dependent methyltransferase [Gaetbulibacter aestuarii]|uniref:Class I SAM-dependent methyltransferase n=1 Tax=Gaetbulibacter aestuarii TaxID=1502358 RepID=A0ABW7N0S9_9FLAO
MESSFSNDFIDHTISDWAGRKEPNIVEKYLFENYLENSELSVLEAGTGAGVLSFCLEKKFGFKNITAFDIIPKMIKKAQDKAKKQKSNIKFMVANACHLQSLKSGQFDYLIYLGQILSMVPEEQLNLALEEAYRLGSKNSTYFFSFLDWGSRWYNPILSFNINLARLLTGRPIKKYYIPEIKYKGSINWHFYENEQHALLWCKKDRIIRKLKLAGFNVKKIYYESDITNKKGTAFYFVCNK